MYFVRPGEKVISYPAQLDGILYLVHAVSFCCLCYIYMHILPLFLSGTSDSDVLLAVDCLDKLLRSRRQVSIQRVLGYVKRLSMVTLQLLPGAALSVLATIRKFIQVSCNDVIAMS